MSSENVGRIPVSELRFSAEARLKLKTDESAGGPKLKAYPDPATGGAPWTIGWGHTAGVKPGMVITVDQAEDFLDADIAEAERIVRAAVKVPLTQGEYDAVVDFVFNVGAGRKRRPGDPGKDGFVTLKKGQPSTMLRKINAGDYAGAAQEFSKWVYGGGKIMGGLAARRSRNRARFEGKV